MINPDEIQGGDWRPAGEILIASDPSAKRAMTHVRRNEAGNAEILTVREGPSGVLATIREVQPEGPLWRYLAEGETQSELLDNFAKRREREQRFSETTDGSIADVCARHALSALREIELLGSVQ